MNNFIALKAKKEKGITLVLALLLTGTVTVAALIIASLLVRELRLTDNMRKSLVAYYGAESGVESALYDINQTPAHQLDNYYGTVGGVSSWKITSSLGENQLKETLDWEGAKEIPLYDADNPSFGVTSIEFCWRGDCDVTGPQPPEEGPQPADQGPVAIEWTILTVHQNVTGTQAWLEPGPRGAEITRGIIPCAGKSRVTLELPDNLVTTDRHVLRFKHIDKYASGEIPGAVDFTIHMFAGDNEISFNHETQFKVTGTAGGVGGDISRALNVTLVPQSPAYNVFDYVIFSDTTVSKEDTKTPVGPVTSGGGGVVNP